MTQKRGAGLVFLAACMVTSACSQAKDPVSPTLPTTSGIRLARGLGLFVFDGHEPLADKPIRVWYFSPRAVPDDLAIVLVFHGNSRNADDHRDAWGASADEHHLLILALEFDDGVFPGSAGYAEGSTFDASNNAISEEQRTFSYIEPLFDHVKGLVASDAEEYYVFGHSAGAQFVHRFLLFKPDNRVARSVAANAGWCTMPDLLVSFPYGLGSSGFGEEHLDAFFGQPLVVLLGERNTDPNDPSLRQARTLGDHRFARGQTFFAEAEIASTARGVELAGQLETVPNVGHSHSRMTPPAARILADR